MTTEPIALKPARPYAGFAQHAAVRAALKPLVDAGVLTDYQWSNGVQFAVRAGYSKVAEITLFTRSRGSDSPIAAARKIVSDALKAAGWIILPARDRMWVAGPGYHEWTAQAKIDAEAKSKRDAEIQKVRASRADALRIGYVDLRPNVDEYRQTVSFSFDEAEALLARLGAVSPPSEPTPDPKETVSEALADMRAERL